jgi:hypothetical protein
VGGALAVGGAARVGWTGGEVREMQGWCCPFIGRRGEGERRGEAVAELGRCAINGGGGGSVEWRGGRFRGRGRGEAAVGEWGGALMARWRRRTGAGRPGRRGRPAAARPVEGERELEVGDGPDGWGPPASCCEREGEGVGPRGRAGPRA